MKYNYYMNVNNTGTKLVTLQELRNELYKYCLSTHEVVGWGVSCTDLKKVQKVLRAIRKGEHYIICMDGGSLCCHATKGGVE